jgi:hypothetical protein
MMYPAMPGQSRNETELREEGKFPLSSIDEHVYTANGYHHHQVSVFTAATTITGQEIRSDLTCEEGPGFGLPQGCKRTRCARYGRLETVDLVTVSD